MKIPAVSIQTRYRANCLILESQLRHRLDTLLNRNLTATPGIGSAHLRVLSVLISVISLSQVTQNLFRPPNLT